MRVLLLVLITLLYATPFFQKGFPVGQDSGAQVVRTAARIKAIADGQFPVRWAADLNYGYGHPGFIFFYSLPGYLGALLYFSGMGLESSYKLLMVLVFIATPVAFYLWIKEIFDRNVSFAAAIVYGFAPYIFLNAFVRIHLGESLALLLVPLTLLCIEKNSKKPTVIHIVCGGALYALLIHAHTILGVMFTGVFAGYVAVKNWQHRNQLLANFGIIAVGLFLSSYFVLPALVEGKYINSGVFLADWYKGQFLRLGSVVYSPWGFGSEVNKPNGLSPQVGPVHVILALAGIVLLTAKRFARHLIIFWSIVFLVGVGMSLSISDGIWSRLLFLKEFQFPWRFTAVSFFSAAVLGAYFFSFIKNKYVMLASCAAVLLLAVPMARFWKVEQSRPDGYYFNYPGTAAYHNEATTIWVAGDEAAYPKERISVISGAGTIDVRGRTSVRHEFRTTGTAPLRILDNTVYFPGWQASIDGQKVPIEFQDANYRGLITFPVPAGNHSVVVRFTESPVRFTSDILSLVGIFLVIMLIGFRRKFDGILLNA